MFEPRDNEMYPTSYALNGRRFCEFHNSPLFNPIQIELWQRMHTAIHSILPLHDRVDLSFPTGRFAFKVHLEEMSRVLETNHIPLVEAEEFGMEVVGPLPVDTSCPGQLFLSFLFDCGLTSRLSHQLVLLGVFLGQCTYTYDRGNAVSR